MVQQQYLMHSSDGIERNCIVVKIKQCTSPVEGPGTLTDKQLIVAEQVSVELTVSVLRGGMWPGWVKPKHGGFQEKWRILSLLNWNLSVMVMQ